MSNPSLTFRLPPADRKRLDDLVTRTGKSLGQLIREALGLAERDETMAYNRGLSVGERLGFEKGLAEGKTRFAIHYYCKICGKYDPMVLPGSKEHKVIVDTLDDKGWGHAACYESKQR